MNYKRVCNLTWRYYASFTAGLPFLLRRRIKKRKTKEIFKIGPSTVFSTFDQDQKQKSVITAGKNALKSMKLPTLKVICWKLKLMLHGTIRNEDF